MRLPGGLPAFRLIIAIVCVLFAGVTFARARQTPPLPTYWTVPPFHLQDQQGRTVTDQDIAGKVVVANLIYTHCPDICPAILEPKMQQLQALARQEKVLGTRVILVSFTADPERDTPAVLNDFAAHFDADPAAWKFLTGQPDIIRQLMFEGFKLSMLHDSDAGTIVHDAHFLLIDQRHTVRAVYDAPDMLPAQVMYDVRALLAERTH